MKFYLIIICICFYLSIKSTSCQVSAYIGEKKIYYGSAYYPEAWDFETVDEDIRYMKQVKMNVMRMAEFSWSLMEPKEGQYDFEWLHKVIEKLYAHDIDVILGTPTATPPAWLGEKYPEIYRVNEDGTVQTHGARKNYSYTSELYRQKCRKIVSKMAAEFAHKKGVIAWQIDNEFSLHEDYSQETKHKWHAWLRNEYDNIDNLNNLWCTQLWSQTYNSFDQIPMPRSFVWHHPSLRMAWYRFNTTQVVDFQNIQVEAIRKHSDLPITHDGMPGQRLNYVRLFENLDFMAVNNYHSFEAYDRIQSNYDRMRGYQKGFHWLFETAPNYSGGGIKGNTWFLHQPDGSMFAALWMNYALGGQGLMFWLFRQHWAGQEMPHGSVISSWGKPAANFEDLKTLGQQLSSESSFLMDNPVLPAQAAIFWDHENMNGLRIEEYANGINYYIDWTYRFYRPISDAFIHRDVIHRQSDISGYKLLFMPLMPYIPDNLRKRLKQWVMDGGTLILGPMSGYRTKEWTSFKNHATGSLEEWTGIHIESRIPVGTKRRPAEIPLMLDFHQKITTKNSEAGLWSEALSSKHGNILASYQTGMHKNKPAIIENRIGKGLVILLGTDPGNEAYKKIVLYSAQNAGILTMAEGDSNVVIAPRKGNKESGLIIFNLDNSDKSCFCRKEFFLNAGMKVDWPSEFKLEPYEVKIIKNKLSIR